MNRLRDPDFSYFFSATTRLGSGDREFGGLRRTSLYDRGRIWRTEKMRSQSRIRLESEIIEFSKCTFSPELSRKGRAVSSSLSSRMNVYKGLQDERRTIATFLKAQREHKLNDHPFRPDLSLTRKYKFSRYLTKPIRITY